MKKKLLTLTILILVHIGIILTVCGIDGVLTESMAQQEVVRFVCDGFYVAGILYLCIGGLIWVYIKFTHFIFPPKNGFFGFTTRNS